VIIHGRKETMAILTLFVAHDARATHGTNQKKKRRRDEKDTNNF